MVLDGVAEVQRDGEVLAERGPGEFFGELAALDWGAGYGHPRLATVVARKPLRLVVLAPAHLNRLMRIAPEVEAAVRAAANERLGSVAD